MLIVQKFGGTSVADIACIRRVAGIIAKAYCAGNRVAAVLSAPAGRTDQLIGMAKSISPSPSARELDALLAIGECQSVALMAMALHELGCPAVSLDARQAKMYSTGMHGHAHLTYIETTRILEEMERGIVLITGFQAVNERGDTTTIARGGSDTTAVAVAASLRADICEIYTDVDGVYTADPNLVPEARKFSCIGYDEMLEMAASGAKVLAKHSVEIAKKYGVKLIVRSSMTDNDGTEVGDNCMLEKPIVSGVVADKKICRISVVGIPDRPGMAFAVFGKLTEKRVPADIILQAPGKDGTNDLSFTVARNDMQTTITAMDELRLSLGFDNVSVDAGCAKVTLVVSHLADKARIASEMFEILARENINIGMISTSETKISVIINENYADVAVKALHALV